MKFVKYFFLLMSSGEFINGAELLEHSTVAVSVPSTVSMSNRIHHTPVPQNFFHDLVTSCEVNDGQRIWATCSQDMQGELWALGRDNKMVSVGLINPPQDFGLMGPVKAIELYKMMGQIYFIAHDSNGLLVYTLNSQTRTLYDQSARALGRLAGAVGAGVTNALSSAKETLQNSKKLPSGAHATSSILATDSVSYSSGEASQKFVALKTVSTEDSLEDRKWFLTSLRGGSVGIQDEIRSIVSVDNEDDSGILVLRKLGSSIAGEDFSSLLNYVKTGREGCLVSLCSSKWDKTLTKAGFTLLQNIYAMQSSGDNGIIFGGRGKTGGLCFVGTNKDVKNPQSLFTVNIAQEEGISQECSITLTTAVIALLHRKNTSHEHMGKALQSLLNNRKNTLVGVTPNYAIISSGSSVEQVGYNGDAWEAGKFILLHAGCAPTISHEGSVLQNRKGAPPFFYFLPDTFIQVKVDLSVKDLSGVMPDKEFLATDLSTALEPSSESDEEKDKKAVSVQRQSPEDTMLSAGKVHDFSLTGSSVLTQSVIHDSSENPENSITRASDEEQLLTSTTADALVVQEDKGEEGNDQDAKQPGTKKKNKKKVVNK